MEEQVQVGASSVEEGVIPEKDTQGRLQSHVNRLATEIGERNIFEYTKLVQAGHYIEEQFTSIGYTPQKYHYQHEEKDFFNVEAELIGDNPDMIIIIGAHYDSVKGSPGGNDNGSGVAALLEISRLMVGRKPCCTLRFVAFCNEEPPFIRTPKMGSYQYAKQCQDKGDTIAAMICLETIGCYSDTKTQKFSLILPEYFYPGKSNYVAFVGNFSSKKIVDQFNRLFDEKCTNFPHKSFTGPSFIPGFNSSDHWSFWQHGYPAFMVTDTGPLRYPHYHTNKDTAATINFPKLTQLTIGLAEAIQQFCPKSNE